MAVHFKHVRRSDHKRAELKSAGPLATDRGALIRKETTAEKGEVIVDLGEAGSGGDAPALPLGGIPRVQMEQLCTKIPPSPLRRWWQGIISKHQPAGRIALDLSLFVLGVMVVYAIDLTVVKRGGPIAIRYLIDLVIYLNHHAVAAVEMLY